MAIIKSYTSVEQSRKLAEILPLESADMCYGIDYDTLQFDELPWLTPYHTYTYKEHYIPCWSLAALLSVLPEYNLQRTDWENKTEYKIVVTADEDNYASKNYDNPTDACVEMVIRLHEQNLL